MINININYILDILYYLKSVITIHNIWCLEIFLNIEYMWITYILCENYFLKIKPISNMQRGFIDPSPHTIMAKLYQVSFFHM